MTVYTAGEIVALEMAVNQVIFNTGSYQPYSPASATLTVYDPSSSVKITAVWSLTNASSAGLYHYILQTGSSWQKGLYAVRTSMYAGSVLDVSQFDHVFEVK